MEGVEPCRIRRLVGEKAPPVAEARRFPRPHRRFERRQGGVESAHGAPTITRLAGKHRLTVVPAPTALVILISPSCRRISE